MFNIHPSKVKVIFFVTRDKEDAFLSFLFNLGYTWIEKDFNSLAKRFEPFGIILIRDDDTRIKKLFERFLESSNVIYYSIGANHLLTVDTIDPFIHTIFVNSKQWSTFNEVFKNINGQTFEELLKEIK